MATETKRFTDRPNNFPWPPIIAAAALVVGWPLHLVLPLPWVVGMAAELLFGFGVVIIIGAVLIDLSAMRTLHASKTTILPNRGSDHLVTKGPFGWSRNPIYLANTMILIGVAFISGIAWYVILAFVSAFLTQKLAIEREEKHLEARFGKHYREYRKKVSRWF